MRRTGSVAGLSGLRAGDHVCWTYHSDDEHRTVLTSYFADGIAAGEKLLCATWPDGEGRTAGYLADAGLDPDSLVTEGRLALQTPTRYDMFSAGLRARAYGGQVRQAVDEGFSGLRLFSEARWRVAEPGMRGLWLDCEAQVDVLVARLPFVALCGFDRRECARPLLEMVTAVHPLRFSSGGVPLEPPFAVHATPDGSIALTGEVDLSSAAAVQLLLTSSINDAAEPVVDVSALRFVDVVGMRAIISATHAVGTASRPVEVRGASPVFRRVWSALGYDSLNHVTFR